VSKSHLPAGKGKRPPLRPLLGLVAPIYARYRFRLVLGFSALLGVDFLQLTIPRYLKKGIDSLAGQTADSASLLLVSGSILATATAIVLLRFSWRTLIIGFSRRLENILRNRLFAHILNLDRPFFERRSTGDIMAHATNDLSAVQMACGMGMVAAADALVMSMAALFFMVHISLQLTLTAVLPMPLLAVSTWLLSGRLHKRFDLVQQQFALLTEFARNTMVSIRLIKGYTREQQLKKDFSNLSREYVRSNIRVAVIQGLLFPVSTLVGNTAMLLVLVFGGRMVISGAITLGDFVAFLTYLYMLVWPMMAVGWVTNLVQRGLTSLARIHELLSAQPLLGGRQSSVAEPAVRTYSFSLRRLHFTYPDGREPALVDLSLDIDPGITGVAGATGSGKSTLCRLLTRQYPVDDDMLFFSGSDINRFALQTVRKHIAYVGQQPVLFSGTVADNIRLAVPDAPDSAVRRAAEMAAIDKDIRGMEKGYDTQTGERGLRLSGGQKQRIALARALLAERPILIIDDALSALDVDTEQQVINNIREYLQDKTVLIVSHRLKLLSCTDRIVLLEQGRVVDQGTHEELLGRNSFYQIMAAKQRDGADA
jgi:ATP-binding cassette subfamily B protein